jgi:hypothetical protein
MFLVVAVGLVAVIVLMARAPNPSDQNGTLPDNKLLPPTGASPIQSPATTGANPLTSQIGKGIAMVTSRLPKFVPGRPPTFAVPPRASTDSSGDKQLLTVSPDGQTRTIATAPTNLLSTRKF